MKKVLFAALQVYVYCLVMATLQCENQQQIYKPVNQVRKLIPAVIRRKILFNAAFGSESEINQLVWNWIDF